MFLGNAQVVTVKKLIPSPSRCSRSSLAPSPEQKSCLVPPWPLVLMGTDSAQLLQAPSHKGMQWDHWADWPPVSASHAPQSSLPRGRVTETAQRDEPFPSLNHPTPLLTLPLLLQPNSSWLNAQTNTWVHNYSFNENHKWIPHNLLPEFLNSWSLHMP